MIRSHEIIKVGAVLIGIVIEMGWICGGSVGVTRVIRI